MHVSNPDVNLSKLRKADLVVMGYVHGVGELVDSNAWQDGMGNSVMNSPEVFCMVIPSDERWKEDCVP